MRKNAVVATILGILASSAFAQGVADPVLRKLIAQQYPEYPKIIQGVVKIEKYTSARKPGGEYVAADEWHGWVVIAKPDESECLKVTRKNFRLTQSNGLQLPAFNGSIIGVECPKMIYGPDKE